MITDFAWNNKKPKIKRDTLIGPKERGGLDLPEFKTISKSLQNCLGSKNEERCKGSVDVNSFILFEKVGGPFIFECDYDVKFLGLNNIPIIYTDVLYAWVEVREQTSDNKICVGLCYTK